ncbi:MAG: RnfH family protein [Burkholderiales bacterium]|nr:RnfH family protein [Burkholderiales bacterium]
MTVEVIYATPVKQERYPVEVASGATLAEAIRASGVLRAFPEIDLAVNRVGIYGTLVALERAVSAGDRIEIYRPLLADPKEARRRRARRR